MILILIDSVRIFLSIYNINDINFSCWGCTLNQVLQNT